MRILCSVVLALAFGDIVVADSASSPMPSPERIAKLLETASGDTARPERLWDETDEQRKHRLQWWRESRFGMFIHFGLYSLPARHEWVKSIEQMSDAAYDQYFQNFNPDKLDVRLWVRAAKRAGMKYIVLTTKHHEGFCLFDSKLTDYKITKTKYGRDLVREFVSACREEDMRVGFYYSLPDWHHEHYTIDKYHPQRPLKCSPFGDAALVGPEEPWLRLNEGKDFSQYIRYMRGQITELLTNYGPVDLMWFDFTMPEKRTKQASDWQSKELVSMVRKLQPGIIINDRLGLGTTTLDGWDFVTPEQKMPNPESLVRFGRSVPWERCQTFSGSWGYHRDQQGWKSERECIELLVQAVSHGGNLIMNVGPTGRGEFDDRAASRLDAYAAWMDRHSRAIYCCTAAPAEFKVPKGTLLTYNAETHRLYLHLLDYPSEPLALPFAARIGYAQFLNDASEIRVTEGKLILPKKAPAVVVPVVEMTITEGGVNP